MIPHTEEKPSRVPNLFKVLASAITISVTLLTTVGADWTKAKLHEHHLFVLKEAPAKHSAETPVDNTKANGQAHESKMDDELLNLPDDPKAPDKMDEGAPAQPANQEQANVLPVPAPEPEIKSGINTNHVAPVANAPVIPAVKPPVITPAILPHEPTLGERLLQQYQNSPDIAAWVHEDMQIYLAAAHNEFKNFRDGKPEKNASGEKVWRSKEKPAVARSCIVKEKPGRLFCVLYVDQKTAINAMYWKLLSQVRAANGGDWHIVNRSSTVDGSTRTDLYGPDKISAYIEAKNTAAEGNYSLEFAMFAAK